jgi:gluconokinase
MNSFPLVISCETIEIVMIIALMGVSGSGKTTVGKMLAQGLGWRYFDADEFHPPASIEKMRRGIPLNDADRLPWLERLQAVIQTSLDKGEPAVLACSALKEKYRQLLLIDQRVGLVYLKGDYDLIATRLRLRQDHYLSPALLASQFEILEEPENALVIDITSPPGAIIEAIRRHFEV